MKRFLKFRYGEKGFTLIELLIVVAILGILAVVIVPNVTGFMTAGTLNAANTEVANVQTAGTAYYAEHSGIWPPTGTGIDGTGGDIADYISGTLKARYTWDATTGDKTGHLDLTTDMWEGIQWNATAQQWVR